MVVVAAAGSMVVGVVVVAAAATKYIRVIPGMVRTGTIRMRIEGWGFGGKLGYQSDRW